MALNDAHEKKYIGSSLTLAWLSVSSFDSSFFQESRNCLVLCNVIALEGKPSTDWVIHAGFRIW